MTWQIWLSNNYAVIAMWSKRWHAEEHGELVSLLSLYLEKNWSKFSLIPDDVQRIKFLQVWMKNMTRWSNSEFNNGIRVNNLPEVFDITDYESDDSLDILAECASPALRNYIIDITNEFGEEGAKKILLVKTVYDTLPTQLKVLYDLYITKNMTIRGIAKLLDIPNSSVYNMVNNLKKEIKKKCGM